MKKPTLEEVKEHFKDAKTVRCLTKKGVEKYTPNYKGGLHFEIGIWWMYSSCEGGFVNLWKEGKFAEITEYKNKTMRTLTRDNYKKIHGVACTEWKSKLSDLFGYNFAIDDEIEIDERIYKTMRDACTPEQHILFDEIFGKDNKELEVGKWYKNPNGLHLWHIVDINGGEAPAYGFNGLNEWKGTEGRFISMIKNFREATEEEVKEALEKEAKRRGFEIGKRTIIAGLNDTSQSGFEIESIKWDGIRLKTDLNCTIFQDGKWAEIIEEETTYKRGQRFLVHGDECILSVLSYNELALISLNSGMIWKAPVKVNDATQVTEKEMKEVAGDWNFKLIE